MGLAHAWGAEEDDVFRILQETHGGQFVDLALINRGLEGEVEVVQGLLDRKADRPGRKSCVKADKRQPRKQEQIKCLPVQNTG